jgi:hypothetical protein
MQNKKNIFFLVEEITIFSFSKNNMKIRFLLILLTIPVILRSQELRIESFKPLPLDVTAREKLVLDVNGEPCALIKVKTGLSNVNFFSNLSVEKTEQHTGEYWVWVSPGSRHFKIAVSDFPIVEFQFPDEAEGNAVYSILLIAIFPEKIIYRDTSSLQPFVSFTTEPAGAEVYINDVFYGKTPLKTNIPEGPFNYRLAKRKYFPVTGNDLVNQQLKNLSFDMSIDPTVRRIFVAGTFGINLAAKPLYGLQAGIIGKTGAYLSAVYSFSNAKPELDYFLDRDIVRPLTDVYGYYYEPNSFIAGAPKDEIFILNISAGLTHQLSKSFFFNYGFGYSERNYYIGLKKFQYDPESNYEPDEFNFEPAYGLINEESFKGMNGQAGFIIRFKKNLLLSMNWTANFGSYDLTYESLRYKNSDLLLSVGYNF